MRSRDPPGADLECRFLRSIAILSLSFETLPPSPSPRRPPGGPLLRTRPAGSPLAPGQPPFLAALGG